MTILKTSKVAGPGGTTAIDGSVFFDGRSYLALAEGALISGYGFGVDDFTLEFFHKSAMTDGLNKELILEIMLGYLLQHHLLLLIDLKLHFMVQQLMFILILVLGEILHMHQYQVNGNILHL